MAQIIDGKRIAKEIKDKLKEEVSVLKERGTKICLAVGRCKQQEKGVRLYRDRLRFV